MLAAGGTPLGVVDEHGTVVGLATLELIGGLFAERGAAFGRGDGGPGSLGEMAR